MLLTKKITFLICFTLFSVSIMPAHPHMFVDMKVEAVFTEDSFKGIFIDWLFDMVFTGSVLMDNELIDPDTGWKSSFTDAEIDIVKSTSFDSLINYNYFTYFNINGKISTAKRALDFSAYMKDNRLAYRFFLPYDGESANAKDIRIAVYDETFFSDIAYVEDNAVLITAPEGLIQEWKLSEKKDAPIFYDNTTQNASRDGAVYSGQTFPVELILKLN